MSKKRILIFASGRGSNAEAIHEATIDGRVNGTVVGVGRSFHCAGIEIF